VSSDLRRLSRSTRRRSRESRISNIGVRDLVDFGAGPTNDPDDPSCSGPNVSGEVLVADPEEVVVRVVEREPGAAPRARPHLVLRRSVRVVLLDDDPARRRGRRTGNATGLRRESPDDRGEVSLDPFEASLDLLDPDDDRAHLATASRTSGIEVVTEQEEQVADRTSDTPVSRLRATESPASIVARGAPHEQRTESVRASPERGWVALVSIGFPIPP
jgi:hypothetical protein